ncbi:MAG: diguanylate cyclase [Thermogemmatispora sp.]|uniref:GGDEF domain-containing response regulator n=1 Tax=Thermogemmatispora sp. TaxID=1968838 RepID=UPI0026275BDA|nr:diguanylate cyclase [Thermogemmatispora sp.]MBX5456242.1 diguanylate cyclase [Thermogemmatispora sp.]
MGNVLVVEDNSLISCILQKHLGNDGDHTVTVLHGEDAIQFALRKMPQLVILNMTGSGSDGEQFIQCLRAHARTMYIPIIVVGAASDPGAKVRAFRMGVDDYIATPFDSEEFLERVRTQLRHVQQVMLSRLIDLPGAFQVEMTIKCKLTDQEPWSLLYLDLDNFKAFNDTYGFLAGNELIRLVGRICRRVVCEYGNLEDFVGHVGGDDFVVVTTPDRARLLSCRIIAAYKELSQPFYRPEDLKRGTISGVDRKGRPYQFPLVSLSIGIVNNQPYLAHSLQEISYLVAEAKRNAKRSSDNIYYISSSHDVASCFDQPVASALSLSASTTILPFSALGWEWELSKRELVHALSGEEVRSDYELRLRS